MTYESFLWTVKSSLLVQFGIDRYCLCKPVLRIRIRRIPMFLGFQDPDTLVQGTDPDPDVAPDPFVGQQIS
jgi:hypothetical protein